MARSEEWHKYQQDAAELFQSLGLNAEVDAHVQGTRSKHNVDVLVTFRSFGIDHTWVVECKRRKRRVEKAEILTLAGVVDDVGADLGIMLSEKGAQSGAITATRFSNIRITNLKDLSSNASADLLDLKWSDIVARTAEASHVMSTLWSTTIGGNRLSSSRLKPGVSWEEQAKIRARLTAVETGMLRARLGRFPVPYDMDVEHDRYLGAGDMTQFVEQADKTLNEVEAWLTVQSEKPWDTPTTGPLSSR